MIEYLLTNPAFFLVWAASLLIAITIHEASHAFAADRLGDPTPRAQGRLTLNPLAHLDPLGTMLMLLFRFGWGKPVQYDPYNLSKPHTDAALISLAGPASNLILATTLGIIIRLIPGLSLATFLYPVIALNVGLAIFNLVPVHPLDGSKIVAGMLPRDLSYEWQDFSTRYGTFILLLLILPITGTSPIISLVAPITDGLIHLLIP